MNNFTCTSGRCIDIRLATLGDLDAISLLNKKWIVNSFDIPNKEDGFLLCDEYNSEDLSNIILAQDTAVACSDGAVVAYYINDNCSSLLDQYNLAISNLKEKNLIPADSRVSIRTQIVVDREFQRLGIPKAMLDFLVPFLKEKYNFLFSIGVNENPKRAAHQKVGWKIVDEDDLNYYCLYDLRTQ
ncbi:GNAT family protein [Taibaiella soli]|uniref:N-acetyltransferase domain-containing protein n=1 Tax=Taibaiella soli TaxID=1649169 RepID=A0A2W2AB92_9BACT|nr:hypothetical protein [Taibaiella soli]PZF72571.1 hypothetical protein DN068_11950 [Taibaiella soli]